MTTLIEFRVLDERLRTQFEPLSRGSEAAAGYDLRAMNHASIRKPMVETYRLHPGERRAFGTGIAVSIFEHGIVGLVASRSGLYRRHGVRVGQGTGTIDADYQGEVVVLLRNDGDEPYPIQPGERIAQLLFQPVIHPELHEVETFASETVRGALGFGSSGAV